ncbi:MAG: hypothetical protein KC731_29445, partial [Myxococcales bacterium]|nr:hypothetical protein [Myxococcales bacterium]
AILPPSDGDGGGFFDSGATFKELARDRATYKDSDGSYYAKWKGKPPQRTPKWQAPLAFDLLSDAYLQENFRALVLEEGAVYLYLRVLGDVAAYLIQLDLEDLSRGLTWRFVSAGDHTPVGNFFEIAEDRLAELKKQKARPTAEAWFIFARDGTEKPSVVLLPAADAGARHDVGDAYFEQVVDPQYVVQSTREKAFDDIDDAQKRWKSRDWLKEMVRLHFSEPWVWFWNNTYQQMFYDIDRDALFLRELQAAEKEASGPLKLKLRSFLQEARKDPSLFLVRRGSQYRKRKRVIGSDESYVYFYDNDANLVTRIPMGVFWKNVNIIQISTVIHDSTKGIVPIVKVITWGGLVVMGWGIFGTATLVNGFRQYVQERVRGAIVDAALHDKFIALRNRILLSLLNPILALVPVDHTNTTLGRSFAFFRGFLLGYTHDALVAMYKRWDALASLEPGTLRALRMLEKIQGVLRLVDEKLSLIKSKVSKRVGELLLERFAAAFVQAIKAIIGLVNNLYFLDYERVKPFLVAYEKLTGEKSFTERAWDEHRHKHLLETFRQYHSAIEREATDVASLYSDVQKGIKVLQGAVWGAESFLILETATGGALVALVVYGLTQGAKVAWKAGKYAGAAAGAAAIVGAAVSPSFRKDLLEAIVDIAKAVGKGAARALSFALGDTINPPRMEKLGQLIGEVWGGITLNRAVYGEKKGWGERWKTRSSYEGFVTASFLDKQLRVSPILPIIKLALFNYVYLVEKVIEDSKQAWEELEDELQVILVGDPEFSDIIENDHTLTLAKIVGIIQAVDRVLTNWLQRLAEEPELAARIEEMASLIDDVSPKALPTFKSLRDGTFEDGGWSRQAVLFVVLSHLQSSLRLLAESIESLHRPVDPKDDTSISVVYLLQMLGFQQSQEELEELLDAGFEETFETSSPT